MHRENAIMGQPFASQLSVWDVTKWRSDLSLPRGLVAHHILIAETARSSAVGKSKEIREWSQQETYFVHGDLATLAVESLRGSIHAFIYLIDIY